MKKIKSNIISFIIGMIVMAGACVGAAILYNAKDIGFNPNDSEWNVDNLEDAINDLKNNYTSNSDVEKLITNISSFDYNYTNGEQSFSVPVSGVYKLEVWGAQGGSSSSTEFGGYGAYSVGEVNLEKSQILYINVGGAGTYNAKATSIDGGYNGGGNVTLTDSASSSGGGATHISTKSGLLSTLSSNKDSVLIVSGGGGGMGAKYNRSGITNHGGHAGGIQGENTINFSGSVNNNFTIYGGTQSEHTANDLYKHPSINRYNSPGSFGKGGDCMGEASYSSAGGSGWYGGTGGYGAGGGAGGSSYIGNSKLTNKVTYCYNCVTSSAISTKTETTTCTSSTPTVNCAKQGNGYAKITLVSLN